MALPDPRPGTTVVVTGASSGIGEALARELAGRGHHLTLVARRRAKLAELAADLTASCHVDVDVRACDLTKDGPRTRLVSALRGEGAREVVGLCNVAGQAAFGLVTEHAEEDEDAVFRTNALATHDLTQRLVRDMVARGRGAVLNLGSIVAFAPMPQNATYAATKAFIQSWSEALHEELRGTGVSCSTVNAGPTRTDIWDRSGAAGAPDTGPGLLWSDPEDVARAAVSAMASGARTATPGVTNKLAVLGYRLAPRTALLPLTKLAQGPEVRRRLLGD